MSLMVQVQRETVDTESVREYVERLAKMTDAVCPAKPESVIEARLTRKPRAGLVRFCSVICPPIELSEAATVAEPRDRSLPFAESIGVGRWRG